jgi:hypothetical protein
MRKYDRWSVILLCLLLVALVPACGGGGGKNGDSDPNITDPGENPADGGEDSGSGGEDPGTGDDPGTGTAQPTIPASDEHPAYAVNVLQDDNGDSVIAINSALGEGAYLFFEGGDASLSSLVGVIYQTPDGQLARVSFNTDGSPKQLETDHANYFYSNYTGSTISVRVEFADGRIENYDDLPIDPSTPTLTALYARALDRNDVGFMIGIVGTSLSVTFCIAPAITGAGTLLTIGCLNALVGTVGTVLGDSEIGAGSSAGDLLIGYFGNDKGAVVTGIMGAVSGLLGWESELAELEVFIAGLATDDITKHYLRVEGSAAEAKAFVRPKAGTGGVQTVTLRDNGGFSFPVMVKSGSYTISVEAKGYLTESYTLAVSGGRVAVSTASDLPDAVDTIVYDAAPADISRPAMVFLDVQMARSPRLMGRIVWPRRLVDGSEIFEIVEGGLVSLLTSSGEKAAFHTVDYVDSGGQAPGGEAGVGGNYDIWVPRRHGGFKLQYSGTHALLNPFDVTVDRAASIVIDIPKTGHQDATTITRSFGAEDIPIDIPIRSRYDGRWFITATPSISSYPWTLEYENAEGETVVESGV